MAEEGSKQGKVAAEVTAATTTVVAVKATVVGGVLNLGGLNHEEAIVAVAAAVESAQTGKGVTVLVPKSLVRKDVATEILSLVQLGTRVCSEGKNHYVNFVREMQTTATDPETNQPVPVVQRIFEAFVEGLKDPFRCCADPKYAAEALVFGPAR